jgi:hypothetical protein
MEIQAEPQPEDDDASLGSGDTEPVAEVPEEAGDDAGAEGDPSPEPEEPLEGLGFDIDDTLRASRVISVNDGSRLVISFEALIDWTSGTGAQVKLTSRTVRENPGGRTYRLMTTLRFTFETAKIGNTNPPMEMSPMEDEWPTYGLNLLGANLKWGHYGPGSAWSASSNNVYLPFSGIHLIKGTGEPRDNKLQKITVWATGGFAGGKAFNTPAKSAIRGGA